MDTDEDVVLDNRHLGAQIRELRKQHGWTLEEFGKQLQDIDDTLPQAKNTLSKIETGQRGLSAPDLVKFALALNVTPNRLLLGDDLLGRHIHLTPAHHTSVVLAWLWASGEEPLLTLDALDDGAISGANNAAYMTERGRFRAANRPHDPESAILWTDLEKMDEDGTLSSILEGFQAAQAKGIDRSTLLAYLRLMSNLPGRMSATNRGDHDG